MSIKTMLTTVGTKIKVHSPAMLLVGGIIADVAPSYRSEVGRLCLQCGSDQIRIWDMKTCPKCQGTMEDTGEKEFWT